MHTLAAILHGHENIDIFVTATGFDPETHQPKSSIRFCGELAIDGTLQTITTVHVEQAIHAVPPVQVIDGALGNS